MNQPNHVIISGTNTNPPKTYKCETCNTTYSDKMYYELHKQSHQKDVPVVQIVMNSGTHQVLPQPAHQQQHQQQQQGAAQIMIPEDQLNNYKRVYGVDTPVYALTPVTQYQVVSGNSRGGTVSLPHTHQGQVIQSYPAPAYVVATVDGQQQLQAITDPNIETQDQMQSQHQSHIQQAQISLHHQEQPIQMQHSVQLSHATVPVSRPARTPIVSVKNRPYRCDQCTASFIESEELEEHKKKHTSDGPFTCEDCHFTFMYKSHFRSHKTRCQKKRAMLPSTQKPILQQIVKREFPTHQNARSPVKLHPNFHDQTHVVLGNVEGFVAKPPTQIRTNNRQNKPQTKFNPHNPSFKRIKKEVRTDRPFECDECDASFQADIDLKHHKSKHTGEGPFRCEECQFVFLYRKLYDAHRRRCEKKRKDAVLHIADIPTSNIVSVTSNMISGELTNTSVDGMHDLQDMQIAQTRSHIGTGENTVTITPSVQMQGQHIIEMRTVDQHGEIQHTSIPVPHQAVIEQVLVGAGGQATAIGANRQEVKYDVIPVSAVDGDCVSQIMNLIKVKHE